MLSDQSMWRIVALAVAATSACASDGAPTEGSSEARANARHYSDRTARVATPRAGATLETGESTAASVHWRADVITAASPKLAAPDTVTRASEYRETRHEGSVGVEWEPRAETTLEGTYTGSIEPDTTSHTLAAGWRRDLLDRHSTLVLGGRINHLAVGAVDREGFSRSLWIYGVNPGWVQILSPTLVARADYSLEVRDGYQANPYRYVPIWGDRRELGQPRFALRERVPHTRFRHALALSAQWSLSSEWFLRGAYRFYLDGWRVRSHTLRSALWWEHPEDWLRLRLRGRGYTQTGARFFERRYTDPGSYRTGDYRLSAMTSAEAGLRADLRFSSVPVGQRFVVSASYDLVHYWLPTYPVFDSMFAQIPSISLKLEFP